MGQGASDVGRVVPVSLERPGFSGFEAGVRAVERIVLDVVLAVIAPRNGELGSPGRFLGVREDGVDLRIGGQKVLHNRHGPVANPLSIASRQDLDARVFGEDVLHAFVAIDRGGRAFEARDDYNVALASQILRHFSATPSVIVTLLCPMNKVLSVGTSRSMTISGRPADITARAAGTSAPDSTGLMRTAS